MPTPEELAAAEKPVVRTYTQDELNTAVSTARSDARAQTLKALGFESVSAAESQITAWKASADLAAKLPDLEKQIPDLEKQIGAVSERLKSIAEKRLAALPEDKRAAVLKRGNTPEAQLDALDFAEEMGLGSTAFVPSAVQQSADKSPEAVKPPLATTAPLATPPIPAAKPQNHFTRHQELEKTNPTSAALYYQTWGNQIEQQRPAGESN